MDDEVGLPIFLVDRGQAGDFYAIPKIFKCDVLWKDNAETALGVLKKFATTKRRSRKREDGGMRTSDDGGLGGLEGISGPHLRRASLCGILLE